MCENHKATVLPVRAFLARLVRYAGVGILIAAWVLGAGTIGYRGFEGLPWSEALEKATMVFVRQGHFTASETPSQKLFVIVYAFSCRLARLVIPGVLLVPIIQRAYRKFNRGSDPQATPPARHLE